MKRRGKLRRHKPGFRTFDAAGADPASTARQALPASGVALAMRCVQWLMGMIMPVVVMLFLLSAVLTLYAEGAIDAFLPSGILQEEAFATALWVAPGCVWMIWRQHHGRPVRGMPPSQKLRQAVWVLMSTLVVAVLWVGAVNIGLSFLCHSISPQHQVERLEVVERVQIKKTGFWCHPKLVLQGDLVLLPRSICDIDEAHRVGLRPGTRVRMLGSASVYGFVMEQFEVLP